jgi:7,8-dihydro-6-hydroxymethylpterin dimethyltransferase
MPLSTDRKEVRKNMKRMAEWQRIEYDNTPIYIRPDAPDWFVPNAAADKALADLVRYGKCSREMDNFLKRINGLADPEYQSRADQLSLKALGECWIHITNRCNMECCHCMFKSSPDAHDELNEADCDKIIHDTYDLGCRLFYFTGGEPFLSKAFFRSLEDVFRFPDTHVVVLTNLSLISQTKGSLRSFPRDRLHFQVSLDGLESNHDMLRGPNAFHQLSNNLKTLKELGFPITLSTTVTCYNVDEMEGIIDFAAQRRLSNVHFLWLFRKGNADDGFFVEPHIVSHHLKASQELAEIVGVKIDNIEALRSQVFSCPGTRYDLSNAGWQSITIGPDGYLYPTPALVCTKNVQCGHIGEGLKHIWENSPVLKTFRNASLNQSSVYRANPFRYIIGGGDIDHSYIHFGEITGGDPYVELYNDIVKWLITRETRNDDAVAYPALRLRMGEKLGECPAEGNGVYFTHSNCVLSLPGQNIHTKVNNFYTKAAEEFTEDLLNPICYEEDLIGHIPENMRYRSYGCGSPVTEADIQQGETVVDLGSGTGIECFISAKLTGPKGKAIGIDMGDKMLDLAEKTGATVARNLGYDNMEFKKSFLEDLPLGDNSADLVISNCVLNLSADKRQVFKEIFRVLKPGGRLVISDITYDEYVPLDIKYNEELRGECISGALKYHDLFGLLNDLGFSSGTILKGYLYRHVKGYDFYSITYQAVKPNFGEAPVLYEFPDFLQVMELVKSEPTCARFVTPEVKQAITTATPPEEAHISGCMVCGTDLVYLETSQNLPCQYCGRILPANAMCTDGHFVCDECHTADAIEIIRQVCLQSRESDAVTLMQTIRSHPRFRIHGPEHHALVPAVILTALRNAGEAITDEQITTAIQRGQTIAGGACAFLGACGAAIGVGIAISIFLGANPYDGKSRQAAQQTTQRALEKIASYNAPRCCQRDSWLALQEASKLLEEQYGKVLTMNQSITTCEQFSKNKECIHGQCPLWQHE